MARALWTTLSMVSMLSLVAPAMAQSGVQHLWNDTLVSRLAALALLEELNSELLSHDSATLVLEGWCRKHHIAVPAYIVAERDKAADKQPTQEQLRRLGVKDSGLVRYRSVKLRCGDRILSEADNWYVPIRLSDDMNKALDTTDISFGRAVASLHFQRHTLSAELLWSPLPQGWETAPKSIVTETRETMQIPTYVLQHHAVLTRADGVPFSEVVETYTGRMLDFDLPLSE